jgi:anti-sigma-K factor RskA
VNPPLQKSARRPHIGWKWMIGTGVGSAALAASITLAVMWGPFREGREVANSKDLRLVSLDSTAADSGTRGRIFWDRDKNDWRMYVFDLAPPPPGRTYELWFITPAGRPVPAGTFAVGKGGRGSLEVPLPPDLGPVAAAAISDEPMSGSQTPTGTIWLKGKVD